MSVRIFLRCYAELNDFLAPDRRQRETPVSVDGPATVAGLVAELGIPPNQVELVLVNGASCPLDRLLRDGERVSLYPVFEALDVTPLLQLRSRPLRQVRFVADAHLGGLARYLRLLGFDTLYENDAGDGALARISATEGRTLLSRDLALLRRRALTHALRIPATRPREQLLYLVCRLDLYAMFRPFTRCMPCNGELIRVEKADVLSRLPPRVREGFDIFWRCRGCGRVYWRGSHYERLRVFVDQVAAGRQRGGNDGNPRSCQEEMRGRSTQAVRRAADP